MFHKDFNFPLEIERPEYKALEEFLDEGNPVINPYEAALLHQLQEESEMPTEIEQYYPKAKTQNTHRMDEWSVLGTQMHYVQHPHSGNGGLTLNQCEEKIANQIISKIESPKEMSLQGDSNIVKEVFHDKFEDVVHHLHFTEKFIDSRDISTTYLGVENLTLKDFHVAECTFPIYSNSHTWGQLVGGSPLDILLDTGASKCYMSKTFFDRNESLHKLPRYKTNIQGLRVGSGELVPAYFLVPVVFKVVRHKFEILALVSDIKGSTDLVFGVKNMFEVEGELSCRNSEFRFLNRAVPIFCSENFSLRPGCKRYVKVTTPFTQPLNGYAIVKIFYTNQCYTMQLKLVNNTAVIDMVNNSRTTMFFTKQKAIGIVDIRSLGYYNIQQCVLEYNLGAHYEFANFNKLASVYEDMRLAKYQMKQKEEAKKLQKKTLKRKAEEPEKIAVETEDPYPWLPADDKRRKMSDDEIIEKFVDLTESDMTEEEKFEFIEILKDYRDAFSLRDEIGECPNIRIDIDVIDDSPFFVRPFPISEEDKPIMDWQMKRMVSLGIIKQGATSHTSPVFLIARKQTQDKRPLVDFRLLNTRVKRQNTATPLLRDIYQMLGSFRVKHIELC